MKSYIYEKGSKGLDNLKIVERDKPVPGPGQVLVKVHATSLNFRDQAILSGNYFGGSVARDTVPLSDGAGEVEAVGAGVTRFKPGDRVASCFFQDWPDGSRPPHPGKALGSPLDGMLAEYVTLSEEGLVPIPRHLTYEEAATLPCAAVTAWHALIATGHLKAGQTVLCLGTGGVSMFALQIAKAAGARVIITSSSDAKLEKARALGADATVNYTTHPDWEQEVLALTDGQGVDNVVEIGGVGTLNKSFKCCGYKGQVSLIGVLAQRNDDINPHGLMLKGGRLQGIFVGHRAMFEDLNACIEVNGIRPVIDRVFEFDNAPDAWSYELSGRHMGKVVIRVAAA